MTGIEYQARWSEGLAKQRTDVNQSPFKGGINQVCVFQVSF